MLITQISQILRIATFQFSHIKGRRAQRGSEEHANGVFEIAKFWLGRRRPENIFLPEFLAIVEHVPSKRFLVGTLIALLLKAYLFAQSNH